MTALLYAAGVVIFLLALFVSIALHELGHLFHAKKFGCRVSQYMIGFGPKIVSFTRGETEYGIKAIPLGGYVKIIGMMPPAAGEDIETATFNARQLKALREAAQEGDEASEKQLLVRKSNTGMFAQLASDSRSAEFELVRPEDADRLFYKLPWHKKVLVMLAGPAVNIALAFFCFLGVYSIYGVTSSVPTGSTTIVGVSDCVIPAAEQRSDCRPGDPVSPARVAGLEAGDQIVKFNDTVITQWSQLSDLIHTNGDREVVFQVIRDGERVTLEPTRTTVLMRDMAQPGSHAQDMQAVGFLGVNPQTVSVTKHYGPIYTMQRMGEMTANSISMVTNLPSRVWNVAASIVGHEQRDPDGPVSIIGGSRLAGEVASSQAEGLQIADKAMLLTMVVGSFNLFLGVFNLIPLLPLDGGHIAGATYEGIRRGWAKLRRRPDPGYVDIARQLPIAYCVGFVFLVMSGVLLLGDLVVPLSSGL